MAKKPLEIDMIAGSQIRDTQGEVLSVEGADISELQAGRGRLNDNHGRGFFNSVGRVTSAKKIFKSEDCDDDRQRYYWDKVKAPFIYVKGYLYDDEDHPNAKAAAAILRNIHKEDTPLSLKASVEGGVVSRGIKDTSLLARTKIHSVALTFTPANNATLVEPLNLDKSSNLETDAQLIKSVMHLAQTDVPSFRHITRDASATKVQDNIDKITELLKAQGVDISLFKPSKEQIVRHSVQQKVADNINKINEMIADYSRQELSKSDVNFIKDCACCDNKITRDKSDFIGIQKFPSDISPNLELWNCEKCGSTASTPASDKSGELEKGWKHAVAAGAVAANLLGTPSPQAEAKSKQIEAVASAAPSLSHRHMSQGLMVDKPLFGAVSCKESSCGENTKHKTVTKPNMHFGMTAGGALGIMPHTVALEFRNNKELRKKYPEVANFAKDVWSKHGEITEALNANPQLSADIANSHYTRYRSKFDSDEAYIYSWLNGVQGALKLSKTPKGQEQIKNHPYVKDVMHHYSMIKDGTHPQLGVARPASIVNKALTAGYGGAGAPSGRLSGAVMQTESLDDGRSGFKHITCDKCGKEQIYAKYQVKCRGAGCGASFSLEKLHKILKK